MATCAHPSPQPKRHIDRFIRFCKTPCRVQRTDTLTHRHTVQTTLHLCLQKTGWRRGVVVSGARRMNEVNARRARLVPGWVAVFGRV